MSWEDAINAAKNDQGYDLSQLTEVQASQLFKSKIDPAKLDQVMEDLRLLTSSNLDSAAKLQSALGVLQTVLTIGRIIV